MNERGPVRYVLRAIVLVYLTLLIVWPVFLVGKNAFAEGTGAFVDALTEPTTVDAFELTLVVAAWAVVINTVFGVLISVLLVRYTFPGRRILSALIDLPLSVSPVVVGLALLLAYGGTNGWFGPTLESSGLQVIYATPGIIMATAFVSLPLVIREVVPVLTEIGTEQEQAAVSLGANAWQTFRRITLPAIRWALVYGVVLSLARSLGEFGAVKIVSGNIVGQTQTATLVVEERYQNFEQTAAYAASFVLAAAAVLALIVVTLLRPGHAAAPTIRASAEVATPLTTEKDPA
ncbi:sulfate ABC transporter permease subunit [Mumia sp. zg.B53]|uniref:sulfate ABC transporter permease n=1 Tax=unclassified Mumia TaxID=2621872 RepID=UPI001C6E97AE|nr:MULTISPECIES: sulfate ABC transporter permease subunit [unclassified Mumia]MBW9204789.1 sulfate ABC transporter permease subunit [Mumia sp. zg.B17]MBW9209206.1 sulfate ABC transporter permease subunit [Mumia sp. zg.B21]MBW9213816.1 sulfate ABC transporter permease subunit [Mumia sp. zg.B53]MDD9350033.1 sulfate ABC transporter permease subunit [Mumia sp.]